MKNRIILTIIILFCLVTNVSAEQNPFSQIETLAGRERLEKIIEVCKFHYRKNYKKTMLYIKEGYKLAQQFNDPKSQSTLMHIESELYYDTGKYEQSLALEMEALKLKKDLEDTIGAAKTYKTIASIYIKLNDLEHAEDMLNKSLEMIDIEKEKNLYSNILNSFCEIYWLKGDYKVTLPHLEKALLIKQELGKTDDCALLLNNMGIIYTSMGKFSEAEEKLKQAVALIEKNKKTYNTAMIYNSCADLSLKMNQPDTALSYLNKINTLDNIDEFDSLKLESLSYLSKAYEQKGDLKKALSYYKKYSELNAKIFSDEIKNKMYELKIQYETDKMIETIDNLKREKIIEKRIRYGFALIMLLSLIALFLIIKAYYSKKKSEKNLIELVDIKNRFFSIIAHDVRGQFSPVLSFTQMLDNNMDKMGESQKKLFVSKILLYSRRTVEFLNNLLEWGEAQNNNKPISPELVSIKDLIHSEITENFRLIQKNISLKLEIPEPLKAWGDKNMLKTIIRNLFNNAVKFTHKNGTIRISATQHPEHTLIQVSDTGIGIPEHLLPKLFTMNKNYRREGTEEEPGTGLGLTICHELAVRNHCVLSVESTEGQGSTFTLAIPREKPGKI